MQKIRKLIRRLKRMQKGKPSLWLIISGAAMIFYFIHRSFEDFTALHNGAPIEQITSFKYLPVFSEELFLVIIASCASMIGAIMLKWGGKGAIVLAIASYVPIGFFAHWGYGYTRQNVTEGMLQLLTAVLCIAAITAAITIGESYIRKRKKRRSKKPT